ncbi:MULTISPECIES: hypothetical protein [unclassified Sinorhizobium]|uniref:hypothetical protein n=1 Tax=unclassified Sinorhizobium TaxID=2613772 RepID=UPI003525268A
MVDILKSKGVGAFWAKGRLSALDQACLSSFIAQGYPTTLFSYQPIPNTPAGVTAADAATIVPEHMVARVRYNGKPDLSHFSDLFRYEMIKAADLVWIDVDLLMTRENDVPSHPDILVKEEQGGLNGAILYVSDKRILAKLSEMMKTKLDKELRWGETGPSMIFEAIKANRAALKLYEHKYFYPIEHYDIWKVLLPNHFDECQEKCRHASTIHLFNNILTTMGFWKELAPPVGSYLHHVLKELDALRFFKDVYPEKIMSACVENFRFRQNGKALGIKAVLKEIVPSIGRSYRHYYK